MFSQFAVLAFFLLGLVLTVHAESNDIPRVAFARLGEVLEQRVGCNAPAWGPCTSSPPPTPDHSDPFARRHLPRQCQFCRRGSVLRMRQCRRARLSDRRRRVLVHVGEGSQRPTAAVQQCSCR